MRDVQKNYAAFGAVVDARRLCFVCAQRHRIRLPNGFRASQSLPYQLIVKRFADERPMLKRSYRNLGDGSDADLSA